MLRYNLSKDGYVTEIGYVTSYNVELTNEPFNMDSAFCYRFDFESKRWIYDPIIMIPQTITRYQGMLYLYRIGRLKELEAKVIEHGGEGGIAFFNSITWERDNPFVLGMAAMLDFTDEDIDNFFIEAAKIV